MADESSVTTTDLLDRARRGDQGAWDAIVDRYARLVWSVIRGFRLGDAATRDVSQTVWLRLLEHLDRIDQPERLGAWLATTARNESIRAIRRRDRERPTDVFPDAPDPTLGEHSAGLEGAEERAQLVIAFATLSAECQELLLLTCSDPPLDYKTVATRIGRPVGSIGPTRARCLDRLRTAMGVTT